MTDGDPAAVAELAARAAARRIPLKVLASADERLRGRYEARFALIRPDQHVAWRGDVLPAHVDALLARVTGHAGAGDVTSSVAPPSKISRHNVFRSPSRDKEQSSNRVHTEGADMVYDYEGQGPLLLLIAGGNGNGARYGRLAALFSHPITPSSAVIGALSAAAAAMPPSISIWRNKRAMRWP
jgi:aromatic ring hydroxylase-like protein